MICLDRRLIKPTGAATAIEAGRGCYLIHIKDKTSSSRLSHLFSQGTVSARVLAIDPPSRNSVRAEVIAVQTETGQKGYEDIIPKADEGFSAQTSPWSTVSSLPQETRSCRSSVSFHCDRPRASSMHLGINSPSLGSKNRSRMQKGKPSALRHNSTPFGYDP
jgi:uncharacterized protein DUF6119